MKISIEEKSIIGTREDQQDSFDSTATDDVAFAVVCDGMGGTQGGAAASQAVVSKLKELFIGKNPTEQLPAFFFRAIDILDESVVTLQKQSGLSGSGTTIVAAAIEKNSLYWLSVGDSRLYIIRGNEIVQVTRDHNFALSLEQLSGEELQIAQNSHRNHRADALISFIGMSGVKIYDINETGFALLPGDKILLTTDGLTKVLSDSEIMSVLSANPLAEGLPLLLEKATKQTKGSQDNTTCIIIQVNDGGKEDG